MIVRIRRPGASRLPMLGLLRLLSMWWGGRPMIVLRRVIVMGLLFRVMRVLITVVIVSQLMAIWGGWGRGLLIWRGLVAVVRPHAPLAVRSPCPLVLSWVVSSWWWARCGYILTGWCLGLGRGWGSLIVTWMGGCGHEMLSLLLLLWGVGRLGQGLRGRGVLLVWRCWRIWGLHWLRRRVCKVCRWSHTGEWLLNVWWQAYKRKETTKWAYYHNIAYWILYSFKLFIDSQFFLVFLQD